MDLNDDILIHTLGILLDTEEPIRRLDIVEELVRKKVRKGVSQRAVKNLINVLLHKRLATLQEDLKMVKKTVISPKNVRYSLEDEKAREKARMFLNLYSKKTLDGFIESKTLEIFERKKADEVLPFIILDLQPDLIAAIKECCDALICGIHEDFIFWKRAGEEMLLVYWRSLTNVLQQIPRDKVQEIRATASKMESKINESMSSLLGIEKKDQQ